MKKPVAENKLQFIGIAITLFVGTGMSLLLPQILSTIIDNLDNKTNMWLYAAAFLFCTAVFLRGLINVLNTGLSERLGWKLCDFLREDLFQHIFSFNVSQHKAVKTGYFLERMEGDINILVSFFSSMVIDIMGSILMVAGILVVFYAKFYVLGIAFTGLALAIILMFIKTQNGIAKLWKDQREAETEALGEFSQDAAAYLDIRGTQKEKYIIDKFTKNFQHVEKRAVKASFWGNIPSTVFFSLLNLGEGLVLAVGIYLMDQGQMTIGDLYLILSYVGLLNTPFYNLKYEFTQMPKVLAAIRRISDVYDIKSEETEGQSLVWRGDGSVTFSQVSFGYNSNHTVLHDINFHIKTGSRVLIEGRTGSGKSTILQLTAGFYKPDKGKIMVGGQELSKYNRQDFYQKLYYIFQFNPVLDDSIRNNITRYNDKYTDEELLQALYDVHLGQWISEKDKGLDERISGKSVSQDEAQLLAWAGVLLCKPKILLIDEFDAVVQDKTVHIVDQIIQDTLKETTILMVTHKHRSETKADQRIVLRDGYIERIIEEDR